MLSGEGNVFMGVYVCVCMWDAWMYVEVSCNVRSNITDHFAALNCSRSKKKGYLLCYDRNVSFKRHSI